MTRQKILEIVYFKKAVNNKTGNIIIAMMMITAMDHLIKTEKKYLDTKNTFLVLLIYIFGT